jgi:dolichol-phosphate mannosyltransferase
MKGLVIIPTYNESINIKKIVPLVLKQNKGIDVLVVDDNSPDGTGRAVKLMMKDSDRVHLLERKKKAGLGKAYVAGFQWALKSPKGYEFVCEMDADFSHDPNELYLFFEALKEGYDAVCGSRYVRGVRVLNWDLRRLFISIFGNFYARFATGVKLTDLTGGYNCYTRRVLESMNLDHISSSGYSFQIEMKAKTVYHGFKIKEVPIIFRDRFEGTTKMSGGIVNEAIFKCWKIRFDKWFKRI